MLSNSLRNFAKIENPNVCPWESGTSPEFEGGNALRAVWVATGPSEHSGPEYHVGKSTFGRVQKTGFSGFSSCLESWNQVCSVFRSCFHIFWPSKCSKITSEILKFSKRLTMPRFDREKMHDKTGRPLAATARLLTRMAARVSARMTAWVTAPPAFVQCLWNYSENHQVASWTFFLQLKLQTVKSSRHCCVQMVAAPMPVVVIPRLR